MRIDPDKNDKIRMLFLNEVNNLSRFDHPNILKIYNATISGDYIYMITELFEGEDLCEYLRDHENLSEDEKNLILTEILNGMQ